MAKRRKNSTIPDCDGDIPVTLYLSSEIINSSKGLAKKAGVSFEQYMFQTLNSRFAIRAALSQLRVFQDRAVGLLEGAQILIAIIKAEAARENRLPEAGLEGVQAIQYALSYLKEYQDHDGDVPVPRAITILCDCINERVAREQECSSDTPPTKE